MRQTLFHPSLKDKAETLAKDFQDNLSTDDLGDLFQNLDNAARLRFDRFLSGVEYYRAHPYRRQVSEMPSIWHEGNTKLLDYSGLNTNKTKSASVLIIPSLINRGYILDLMEDKSFVRYLADHGFDCYLVDWDSPNETEKNYDLEDYILRLARIATFLKERHGHPPAVIGYCMGGTLAAGLTASFPDLISAFIALATPWDFEADGGTQKALLSPAFPFMDRQIAEFGQLPTETLQLCFGLLDPMLAMKKFSKLATSNEREDFVTSFVALEDWLNDGVPLAGPTAKSCLKGWYQDNTPARNNWLVNNKPVLPENIKCPSLCIIPATDRIVPPESAKALAARLPTSITQTPPLGHIGMMSGSRAEKLVWSPVVTFLKSA